MMRYGGYQLDAFQEKAVAAVEAGRSVVVAAPTGAGKTVIAEYAVEKAVREGWRLVYTAPIKALSNQKYRDFRRRFGSAVGIVTGDVSLHPEAPVVIMTTEIFRNEIFESPERIEAVRWVVFDEVHYMDDDDRGTVWEESLVFAPPHIRFICLSATIPNLGELRAWMARARGSEVEAVEETVRPVPLRHRLFVRTQGFTAFQKLEEAARRARRTGRRSGRAGRKATLDGLLDHVVAQGQVPALYFAFQRRTCEDLARTQRRRQLLSGEERRRTLDRYGQLLAEFEVDPGGPAALRLRPLLEGGVAYHHAGLLPTFKEIVERLFTEGHIRLLFTTETFALGINMPAAAVIFDTLDKFDGVRFAPLMTREYYQMAGRAGRRGMDEVGWVYGQAEPRFLHPRSIRETVFGSMEPVVSRLNLGYATILNLYERLGEGIFEAAEKSFAAFQRSRSKKKRRSLSHPAGGFARLIRARLRVLENLGYLRGRSLLPKGRFAAQSAGYELPLTELVFGGTLEDLDPPHLVVALTALLCDPRKADTFAPLDTPAARSLRPAVEQVLSRLRKEERRARVPDPHRPPDFRLSRAAWLWSRGAGFPDLAQACSTDPGDLVRTFRMTHQLLRQLLASRAITETLRRTASEAARSIHRDEVDAERQLRRGDGPLL